VSDDHLIRRPARLDKCHGCGEHILTAMDGGAAIAAEPQAITINAEITARLSGLPVFDVITWAFRVYLIDRDLSRVCGARRHPVVAAHQCPRGARPRYQLIPPKKPAVKKTAAKRVPRQRQFEEVPF
jgi:hypothetical protein